MKDLFIPIAIFAAGFVYSFINIMAGGGSVLTLGVMLLLGLEGSVANGTNRIGLLVAGMSGAAAYKSEKIGNMKESMDLSDSVLHRVVRRSSFRPASDF
jgi:uncharacterized membrane protein YfcA